MICRRIVTRQIIRFGSSGHGPVKDVLHPKKYLEVANSWPHEEYAPEHYASSIQPPQIDCDDAARLQKDSLEGEEEVTDYSYFTASTIGLLSVLALLGIYRYDRASPFITDSVTAFQETYDSAGIAKEMDAVSIPKRRLWADDLLILGSKQVHDFSRPHPWTFYGARDRASDFIQGPSAATHQTDDEITVYPYKQNDDIKDL